MSESFIMSYYWNIFPILFIVGLEYSFIATISNCFVNIVLKTKYSSLKIVVYSMQCLWYIYIFIVQLLDLGGLQRMLKQISQFYFATYVSKLPTFYEFETPIQGLVGPPGISPAQKRKSEYNKLRDVSQNITIGVWFLTITIILAATVVYKMKQLKKVISKQAKSIVISTNNNTDLLSGDQEQITEECILPQAPVLKKKIKINYQLVIQLLIGIIWLITFLVCLLSHKTSINAYIPGHWKLYQSAIPVKFSKNKYVKSIEAFRQSNPLPTDLDWLDQRVHPKYPLVYGNLKQVCSYNPDLPKCKLPAKINTLASSQPPNVVILLIESFSPSPTFMENHIANSAQPIESGPMFKERYLPTLHELSKDSLNIASLSSQGLPTIFGWLGFIAGEQPYSNEINIVRDVFNDADDFPSWFKLQGYHNYYVAPSELNFDGEQNWAYRGRPATSKAPTRANSFPLWFDEIYYYFPTPEQAAELNVTTPTYSTWVPDRISAREFTHIFNQTKKNEPLLGFWFSCDTHYPFGGKDDEEFYKPFEFNNGTQLAKNKAQKVDSYSTMAKYTDAQIKHIVEYLRINAQNTIIIITGDHGAREAPLINGNEHVDKFDEESSLWDATCNNKPFAQDQLFNTAAMISYLGDDVAIREKFDQVKNKVIKTPTDHQDLVRTMYNLIQNVTQKSVPSSRNGRDLFELANNLTNGDTLRNHTSLRYTSIHAEAHINNKLIRYHSKSGVGQQFDGIYPTCVRQKLRPRVTKEQFKHVQQIQRLYDYLNQHNQIYNYEFRNFSCEYPTLCEFPQVKQGFKRNDTLIVTTSWIGISFCIGLIITILCLSVQKCIKLYNKKK
ncbi:Sulfatase [Hexamita inflata]|uniref:Sulfatase n=1 Tax=Hexamita inflata TaxID=28002 RepID=A0AA86NH62_9EUKA|nr:Sulfatase [Hexamita inflata]